MRTAIIPVAHRERAFADRLACDRRASRSAGGAGRPPRLAVRSAAYWNASTPTCSSASFRSVTSWTATTRAVVAVVRDRPARHLHVAPFAALRDADDLVPLLALALDVLDQEIVVLGRDDVEHGELERLVRRVPEGGLEGLVDLGDPAVHVDEHRVEERVGEQAEAGVLVGRRSGPRMAASSEAPKAESEAGGHVARIGIESRVLKAFEREIPAPSGQAGVDQALRDPVPAPALDHGRARGQRPSRCAGRRKGQHRVQPRLRSGACRRT